GGGGGAGGTRTSGPGGGRRGGVAGRGAPPAPSTAPAEVARRVAAALAALPAPQREACSLRLFGELTLEEIASVTGASLGTVKSRLFYGQRRLRELLADMNPGSADTG